jgi:hypothetical protein
MDNTTALAFNLHGPAQVAAGDKFVHLLSEYKAA